MVCLFATLRRIDTIDLENVLKDFESRNVMPFKKNTKTLYFYLRAIIVILHFFIFFDEN
jgi:hypothetical protein